MVSGGEHAHAQKPIKHDENWNYERDRHSSRLTKEPKKKKYEPQSQLSRKQNGLSNESVKPKKLA